MEWKHLMKPGLQAACEQRRISKTGSKADMIERLEKYERSKNANVQRLAPPRPRVVQPPKAVRSEPIRPVASGLIIRPEPVRSQPMRPNASGLVTRPAPVRSEATQQHCATCQPERPQEHEATPRHDASGRPEAVQKPSYPDYYRSESPDLPTPVNPSDVFDLTEAELEQRCRDNFTLFREDAYGEKRRGVIKVEFGTKCQQLYNKRDDAIDKARTKCKEGVSMLAKERDDKLAVLNAEIDLWAAKQKVWAPAWRRLKEINAARGTFLNASKFDPDAHYRPVRESLPTPSASNSPKVSSPTSASARRTGSATVSGSPITGKRRAAETDDDDEVRYIGRRRINNDEHATNSTIQTASPRSEASSTSSSPADSSTQSIRTQLRYQPYVFLPDRTIRDESRERAAMESMLQKERFAVKGIRTDERGFYWVFEDTSQGDREAEVCYDHFQGRLFNGEMMKLVLHRRRAN